MTNITRTDRIHSCELRNDSKAGAGWDVVLLEGDELLFSKRCATEADARYAAQVMKDSTRNAGWIDDEHPGGAVEPSSGIMDPMGN